MEERESSERKSLFIRTIIIIILLLLAFLSTILYVYLYPKTRVNLYDTDYAPIRSFEVKRYSTLSSLPDVEKIGYTFKYWTYDDFELNGGTILDKDAELTTESVNLYANYVANSYRVTYHVQYWDELTQQYQYKTYTPPRNTYPEIYDYGSKIDSLPTGRDAFGNLLPDFCSRSGYHFVGWTTKVMSEDDPELSQYLKYAGQEYIISIPSDIDFYAFFAKNTYTINLHTGIEYQLDGSGNPVKDASGEYIIKNISNDPNNDRESVITDEVRFMDSLLLTTDKYNTVKLNQKNAGMAYDEYEFKGWYLDADYTLPISNQSLLLKIQADGRPYYEYKLDGETKIIWSYDTGKKDDDNNAIYEFDIYSKWQRKTYEINFSKNSNSSSGKIEPIYLYRVFLDDQGIIIDEYGKYYNDGNFTYEGYQNGGHYCKVNLETLDVVDETFRNSNKSYRLVGWTDSNKNIDNADVNKYAWWQQEPWTEDLGKNRITGLISYDNNTYIHSKSESVTLYAQWSKIYTITFAYATGINQKHFEIQGIEGEWFILPNMATIIELTGEEWTKKYNYFAGWVAGDPQNSLATRYEEKLSDGTNNPNYKYTISRANARLNAYWKGVPYTINFYLNESGTDGGTVFTTYTPVYGGTYKYFPSAPTREGYLFDGWSKTDYLDNEYSTKKRQVKDGEMIDAFDATYTSSSNFLIDGNINFYASWTQDFEIEYDANGGTFAGNAKTLYKYSDKVSSSQLGQYLKITLYVGNGISVSRDNYEFKGWNVLISDGVVSDKLIKTSATKKTTFDFYEIDGKYYYYDWKADGITISDSEKTEMILQSGKKVVLVANWEPKKYNVKIVDTLANEGQSVTSKTYQVAFNEDFTFPTGFSESEKFDNKIGYKLVGFSATNGGEIVYALGEDGSMPTIPANTITSGRTFYTVYEQKNIEVKFKAIMPDNSVVDFDTYNQTVAYGAKLTLPTISSVDFGGKNLVFKYWYYLKNDVEVKVATGDPANYHNEFDELIIYGHFEADSYQLSIAFTNPYSDVNFVVETLSLGNWEKDSTITTEIYNTIMSKVYEKLNVILADYLLKDGEEIINGIYKGFKLDGMYTTNGYEDKFEVNKKFSSKDFQILGFTPMGMTLVTKWTGSNLTLTYKASEEDGAQSKSETTNFASSIVLKGSDYLTLDGGKIIKSWYIYDGETKDFFDCGATICDINANVLQKYIVWDLSGNGTIIIYANTEQVCTVEYYSFDGSTAKKINTQSFIWGETADLISGDEALVYFAGTDMKFEGWYYNGEKVSTIPTLSEANNFSVKLYANLTFVKSYWLTEIDMNLVSEELLSSETIDILRYNAETNEYSYITSIIINSLPELTDDQIPNGYTYYGLKFGDNIYKKGEIEGSGVVIGVTGDNIKLATYYTQTYTITYTVSDDITFEDGTTDDKVETYIIGYDGSLPETNEIKIKYSAKKSAYIFSGWKIYKGGELGSDLYKLNDVFNPTTLNTILKPIFDSPTSGTINAKIKLVKEDGSDIYKEISKVGENPITNGYTYTFAGENGASSEWTSLSHDLYKWVNIDDGSEYLIGETFTIPVAIEEGQVFTFVGVWIEKYIVEFKQPTTHSSAIGYTDSITLHRGVEYKLTQTPYIPDVEGVEFKNWIFDNNGTDIIIHVGDSIVLNKDNSTEYRYIGNVDGSLIHYLPMPSTDTNKYTLMGEWAVVTYDISLIVTDPDNSANVYTLTLIDVPFGTTIGSRDMLNADYIYLKDESSSITSANSSALTNILALENDSRGIIGWSTTNGATEPDANALSEIKSNMTLYAVWQTKYDLSFATSEDFEYEGGSIATTKHLPSEEIDVNNVIKSIYAKGYTTVYYENGKYYIANGTSNDYYQVTGFTTSVPVLVGGESTSTLSIDASNKMPTFTFPASNVVLTPKIEKIYKVSFYDNTTTTGGEIIKSGENEKYFEFLKQGQILNLSSYSHSRTNFTFVGWNTDFSSDSVIESVTASTENIDLYAIWASNRKAMFQISLASAGGTTKTTLIEFPLTKDNKINRTTLESYLNNELQESTGAIKVFGVLEKNSTLFAMGHSAYTYNFKNFYLDGFYVTKNGSNVTFDLDNLCAEDFGGEGYNTSENVVITFNLFDIFKINYVVSESDVEGTINTPDYFVAIDSTRVGKLVEKTEENSLGIDEMILPVPSVTRLHYVPTYWSTNNTDASAVKYSLSTVEQRTLSGSTLTTIATSLQSNYNQEYTLYVLWEFAPINVYVYAIADVIDTSLAENEGKAETTLLDPYSAYLGANATGSDIAFKNIPNLITVSGKKLIVVGNYRYNNIVDGVISNAQLKYNDTFTLERNDLSFDVGTYRLAGFSTQLVKLGDTLLEESYFALGEEITITDAILSDGALKLYPYYEYKTKDVTVYISNGSVKIKQIFEITDGEGNLLTSANAGFVYIPDSMPIESEQTVSSNSTAPVYSLNKFTRLSINAFEPVSSSYVFDKFVASDSYPTLFTVDETDVNICYIKGSDLFASPLDEFSSYTIRAIYSASKVKLTIKLDYGENSLKTDVDNGELLFANNDIYTTAFEKTLTGTNTTETITVNGLTEIAYTLKTTSNYYTYTLYSNGVVLSLNEGKTFAISDLTLSTEKDEDGYYLAEVIVKATPKTYEVSFIMNLGVLNADTIMSATSDIYNGVTGFAVVSGKAIVFANSLITLPTADDIVYAKNGKFLGFYLNGDTSKTYQTTYTITQDTTFNEAYDDNAYSIQYVYGDKVKIVSGISPNSEYTIGIEEARNVSGYTLAYWTFENGQKAFDDGQIITITKSYILIAKYTGESVTLKYTYDGGETTVSIENGQDITLLDPSILIDTTHSDDKYIYGWKYNDNTFKANSTIAFDDLGYTFVDGVENTITLQAVYYSQYKYTVEYITTGLPDGDLSNAGDFATTTFYVRTTNASGTLYNEDDLKVKISDVEPLIAVDSLYFDTYKVEYSIDGTTWIAYDQNILIGATLNLVAPKDNGGNMLDTNTTILYKLTPTFKSTNAQISIEYNLTNPSTNESVNSLSTVAGKTVEEKLSGITFNSGATFTDDNMLTVSYVEGNATSHWKLTPKSIEFDLTIETLDWFKYLLKGYRVQLYIGESLDAERTFLFGNEANENRNISGYSRAVLTPIWEQKYTLYYYDQAENLVKTEYFDYSSDLTQLTLRTQDITTDLDAFSLSGYAWVGWTKSIANNHIIDSREDFVGFGKDLALNSTEKDIHLYPAQSKIYTISFETIGIDDSDTANFVMNTIELPKIYLGISDDDTIDLSNVKVGDSYIAYTDTNYLYSACDKDKYNFMLFSVEPAGNGASEKIVFTPDNISSDIMTVYAVWQKKAYTIGFTFEANENSDANTNVLTGYSFSMPKYHGDKISLGFTYNQDKNTYTFAGSSNLKNADGVTLEAKINAIILEANMDYLTISKMTYMQGNVETEIDWSQEFEITSPLNIKVVFGTPIYRLSYVVLGGMTYDGERLATDTEVGGHVISVGGVYEPVVDLSLIKMTGYDFNYWTTSETNANVNFFEGGNHTITSTDLNTDNLSSTYRLRLYPHYATVYEFNFYYFDSLDKLKAYKNATANTTDETVIANARNTYYTKLSGTGIPTSLEIGSTIGLYEKDSEGNYVIVDGSIKKVYIDAENKIQKTIFDDYLASNPISITLDSVNNITAQIDKFYDLYNVFTAYEYQTEGKVSVDGSVCLALDNGNSHYSLYTARTYGNGTKNDVYLEYSVVEHTAILQSTVVKSDLAFDKSLSEKYDVIAEFAGNENALNDSGADSVDFANRRSIVASINNAYVNSISINYQSEIYLINSGYFIRAEENDSFVFQGWRVLEETTVDDITTYTLKTLEEFASVTAVYDGEKIKYWKVSNIKQDLKIVAIFTERLLDVEITLTSIDNIAENLKLSVVSLFDSKETDWSDFGVGNATNHTTKYNIKVLYNSYLTITTHADFVDSYQIGAVKINSFERTGDFTLPVNKDNTSSGTIDGKIVITVNYEQLTYALRIEANQEFNGRKFVANLDAVGYLLGAFEGSATTIASIGTSYNYFANIPVGATITNAKLGVPTINNFTFAKWQYLDGVEWKDITSDLICKNIVNSNKEIYVRAIFTPNEVNIEFYVETYDETSGGNIQKQISELSTTAVYGSTFTLPYVVIETETYIISGWNLGNFGTTINISSNNNSELNTLTIVAVIQPILYVVFDKGTTEYTIPSDYPTNKTYDNSLVASPVEIPENKDYYYKKLSDSDTLSIGSKLNSGASSITLKGNTFDIPNVEIESVNSVPFEAWITKLSQIYYNGETYEYTLGDEGTGDKADIITLTAQASNFYNVEFIITNPANKDDTKNLTSDIKVEPAISSIKLLISKDTNVNYVTINNDASNTEWTRFDAMSGKDIQSAYFVKSINLDDYKFYGWSTERVNAFLDIKASVLDSEYCYGATGTSNYKYLPYYSIDSSNVCKALAYQQIAINMLDFINKTGVTTFYTIWETKYSVTFETDDGTTVQTAKYGRGELVEAPNPNTYSLTQESQKWIGWKINDSTKLEFVNNEASYYFGNFGTANETWKPLWETGYTLTLDMNFNREAIAQVFASYGVTKDYVLDNMGYPYFAQENSLLSGTGNTITLDEKTYYQGYKYGNLWTIGNSIDISELTPIDKGIYPTSIALSNATWCDTYYTFAGWSKTATGDTLTLEELQNLTLSENTTLYAIWTARTFNVYLYKNQEKANAKGSDGLIYSETVSNTIEISFADDFIIADYETAEYIDNFDYLKTQDKLRFSKWNVISPMTRSILETEGGIPLINDLYLYPDYVDEYTVLFKTAQGDAIANQEDNYQKVINGETVKIKDYIENTLQQSLGLISKISYINNLGSTVIIDKTTESIVFNSSALSSGDQTNKTFTIYLTIEAKVYLYAPTSSTDKTYVQKSELDITPDSTQTVLNGITYSSEYQLDLSDYNNVPDFAGWFYYKSTSNDELYKTNDLDQAIARYKVTVIDGTYYLVVTDKNGNTTNYVIDTTNGISIIFYAKLTVTETISLGTLDSDTLIQKYAKLSVANSDYAKVENSTAIDKNIKSITIKTIYNSPQNIAFYIETEGYIVNEIKTNINGITYTAQNDLQENWQAFATDNYNAIVRKTSNTISGDAGHGMYNNFVLLLNHIKQNGGYFKFGITPYVFDVTYKANSDISAIRQSNGNDFSYNNDTHIGSIDMYASNYIYRVINNELAYESNGYSLNYIVGTESITNADSTITNYQTIKFTGVPYGISIQLKYVPLDDMYYHFDSYSFGYIKDETDYIFADAPDVIDIENNEKITYKPIEETTTDDGSAFLNHYTVTGNFVKNKISSIQLNLDFKPSSDNDTHWVNVIKNNNNSLKYTSTTISDVTTYTWTWLADTNSLIEDASNKKTFYAGDDLTSMFAEWKEAYHAAFDEIIDTAPSSYNNLSMAQVLRYFWLDDSKSWTTYSKNKPLEQADLDKYQNILNNGSLVENVIYSYHEGTVVLHIDLDKAFLINAQPRTLDYTTGEEIVGINRANISLTSENTSKYYVYNASNTSYSYSEGTAESGLLVKAPFNSKLIFTANSNAATDTHVAYTLKEWNVLNNGTISSGVDITNKQITIDSTTANGSTTSMFAKFGTNKDIAMPEIYLRADVEPITYSVNFDNQDGTLIKTLTIAYDKDIYDLDTSKYYYYAYTLNTLYNSEKHTMPRFKLASENAPDDTTFFVSVYDNLEAEYGDLKYLFKYWSLSIDGIVYSVDNFLTNKTNASGICYNNITLYACYEEAQELTFVRYGGSQDENGNEVNTTHALYIAKVGFKDQFGVDNETYDTSLMSKNYSVYTWISEKFSNAYKVGDNYEYYLAGIDNYKNIKVTSLDDIENAYKNSSSTLKETNYYIYPRITLTLNVFEHRFDEQYQEVTEYIFATLGGKIEFSVNKYNNNITLSNVILNSENSSEISPKSFNDYTFGLWYLGDEAIVIGENNCTIIDASLYPHYNTKIMIETSVYGTSKITDERWLDGEWKAGDELPLLSAPSFKYITEKSDANRKNITLKYAETGKDGNGYQYAILNVIDNTDTENIETFYTIKFVAIAKYFNKIAFKISTANGKGLFLSSDDTTYSVEDSFGSYSISPVAYPDKVTITLDNFAIVNLPNENQYSSALTSNTSELKIAGGSTFELTMATNLSSNSQWKLNFIDIFGEQLDDYFLLTTNSAFNSNNLSNYLNVESFRWQYKKVNTSTWLDCPKTMLAFDNMSVRLVAEWISYSATFEKMSNQTSLLSTSYSKNTWDLSSGVDYSNYKINESSLSTISMTIYKGETLKYNKSTMEFEIQSNIAERNGTTISITDTNGYKQGWLQKTGSDTTPILTALTSDNTYSDIQNLTFVAWVEAKKTISVNVDSTSANYGYGDVSYAVSDPMGAGDKETTALTIDKANKTYGSITVGASSKVTLTFAESNDVHHDLKAITYSTDNNNNLTNIQSSEVSKTLYAKEIKDTVTVWFDAGTTETQYYIVDGENRILGTYTLYGGYIVGYTGSDTITGTIIDFWGNKVREFTIYKNENETTSESANKYYPRNNCYIDTLGIYKSSSIETKNDINNIITSDLGTGTTIESGSKTQYTGTNEKFVLKFNEYVHTLVLNFEVKIINAVDSTETKNTLSTSTAYIKNGTNNITGSSYEVSITKNKANASMTYGSNSVNLIISDNFNVNIVTGYDAESKRIFKLKQVDINGNECVENASTKTEWDVLDTSYTVKITLATVTEIEVDFKLTLPYDMDLRNLYIMDGDVSGNGKIGLTGFNKFDEAGNVKTFKMKVGSTLSVKQDGDRYILTITPPEKSNGTTTMISYKSTPIYNISGWYLDTSDTHSDYSKETKTIGSYSYDLISHNGTKITTNTELVCDSTIVLVADRNPVNIYVNSTYWENLDKSSLATEEKEKEALKNADFTGTKYTVPGGLVELKPLDLGESEDLYVKGDTTYLGRNNVDCPITITNMYRETVGNVFDLSIYNGTEFVSKFNISGSNGYAKTGFAVVGKTKDYDIELTQSNEWVLVEYPAIADYVTVNFYASQDSSSSTKLKFVKDKIDLPIDVKLTSQIINFFAKKSSSTRLFVGLESDNSITTSKYGSTIITFDAGTNYDTWTNNGSECILSGYKVVSAGTTYTGVTTLDLSKYSGEINIYPEFKETKRYTITIEGPFDNAGKIQVYEGNPFNWSVTLNKVTLSKDGYGNTAIFYTILSNNQVVMSMGGTYGNTLLKVSNNTLVQVSNTLTIHIDSVTQNYTFSPTMGKISTRTITYTPKCTTTVNNLTLITQKATLKNILDSIATKYNGDVAKSTIPTDAQAYFGVDSYTQTTSGFTVNISHTNCKYVASTYTTTSWEGCYEYKQTYNECYYCGNYSLVKSEKTGNTNHEFRDRAPHPYDDIYHYYDRVCSKCGYMEYNYKKQAHIYGQLDSEWSYNDEQHWKNGKCKLCGKVSKINIDHHYETVTDYYNETQHGKQYECSVCGSIRYKNLSDHNFTGGVNYRGILWNGTTFENYSFENGIGTKELQAQHRCTETGVSAVKCYDCDYIKVTGTSTINGTLHNVTNWNGYNETQHYGDCQYCGTTIYENHDIVTIREATCSKYGIKQCSICTWSKYETLPHSYYLVKTALEKPDDYEENKLEYCSHSSVSINGEVCYFYTFKKDGKILNDINNEPLYGEPGYYYECLCKTCNEKFEFNLERLEIYVDRSGGIQLDSYPVKTKIQTYDGDYKFIIEYMHHVADNCIDMGFDYYLDMTHAHCLYCEDALIRDAYRSSITAAWSYTQWRTNIYYNTPSDHKHIPFI